MIPPIVHLPNPDDARFPVTRALTERRAFPLNEPDMPSVKALTVPERNAETRYIAEWLDVEKSARYQRTPTSTWCNIYAFDFCQRAGVYLPHVFWTKPALKMIAQGVVPRIVLREGSMQSVNELSANALFDWLVAWGPAYGWVRTDDAGIAQGVVNQGGIGVVCASIKPIGHVAVIVPEADIGLRAMRRANGAVAVPLQSQAGAQNFKFRVKNWWSRAGAGNWGFFVHKAPLDLTALFGDVKHVFDSIDDLFA